MDTEKIKQADRATFLLNYLFVVLRNNQFGQSSCPLEVSLFREVFLSCLDPYIALMSQWVSKGELNDPFEEFFICLNRKLGVSEGENSAREQWDQTYKFRSINLTEFEDRMFGMAGDGSLAANKIEISIPIFFRPYISEILSIGKSVKIIRYIAN